MCRRLFRAGLFQCLEGLDLRFEAPGDEAAFVASRARRGWRFVVVALAIAVAMLVINRGVWIKQAGASVLLDPAWRPRTVMMGVNAGVQILGVVFLSLARVRFGRFPKVNYEPFVIFIVSFDLMMLVLGRDWNQLALVRGELGSGGATLDNASDEVKVLLNVDMIITGICLIGPVRVHALISMVAFAVTLYFLNAFIIGTPLASSLRSQVLALFLLAGLAVVGAWQNEARERKEWLQQQALQARETELDGVSSIARGMRAIADRLCELVFKLDEDLCVCEAEKSHESFFGRPLCGERFSGCLAPGDCERFEEMISQTTKMQMPHCIHATLVSRNQEVEAEIVAVDTGGKPQRYIVGLRTDAQLACSTQGSVQNQDLREIVASQSVDVPEDDIPCAMSDMLSVVPESTVSAAAFRGVEMSEMEEMGQKEHWWISSSELRVTKPVWVFGCGGYGQVIAATLHGRPVAVKTADAAVAGSRLRALSNELRVFRHVRHPNLVQFYGAVLDGSQAQLALVFELVRGATLDRFVGSAAAAVGKESPTANSRYLVLSDVCSALWYLHRQQPPIVHGDLKPGNIMVEQAEHGPQAKLIDFGLSTVVARNEYSRGGTRAWAAPESIQSSLYRPRPSSDVFSFGWLVLFALTGLEPYGGLHGEELVHAIRRACEQGGVSLPEKLPEAPPFQAAGRRLAEDCLIFAACMRPTMQAVHAELAAWRSGKEDLAGLGLHAAVALLPSAVLDLGSPWLCVKSAEAPKEVALPIQLDLDSELEITLLDKSLGSLRAPDCVGKSFLEFLVDPNTFAAMLGGARSDLARRGALASHVIHLSGVALKASVEVAAGAAAWEASMKIFFPDASGRVSIRILALSAAAHSETARPPTAGRVMSL